MSKLRQLTPQEVMFIGGETPAVYQHTAGLVLLDSSDRPGFGFEVYRRYMEQRVAGIPQFHWRLHEVPLGLDLHPGWHPHKDWGKPDLSKSGSYLKITDAKGAGTFLAYGSKLTHGVVPGGRYVVALDYEHGTHVQPITVLTFYNASGAKIGSSTSLVMPLVSATGPHRYVSPAVVAPESTVAMRVSVGGRNQASSSTFVKVKSVVLCLEGESTAAFDGDSGANYGWLGTARQSASVFHPPRTISITSSKGPIVAGSSAIGSVHVKGGGQQATLALQQFDRNGGLLASTTASAKG